MFKRIDPLLCEFELNLHGAFFPAGFPLHLATNSQAVMDAAGEAWGAWKRAFDTSPLELRVIVQPSGDVAVPPVYRKQGALISAVSDAYNFAAADAVRLTANFWLSERTAADCALMRWHYLDALVFMLLTQQYVVSLHGACVARNGRGILLCGHSGAGKSTLSVAAARAGFTFVSDDCTWVRTDSNPLIAIGKPHQVRLRHDAARHFPELSGLTPRALPNAKLSIEPPTSMLENLRTASQVEVANVVFLDRMSGGEPRLETVAESEANRLLLADLPSYGAEVNATHERTVARLAALSTWRLHYAELTDAIRLLSGL
jgi:hypothetical protein